jgi:outer membrane receptor protein involved in Fe transport
MFGYYSLVDDLTEVRPDTYEGSDWIDFNGNGVQDANEGVVSHQAVGGAYIYGFELEGRVFLHQISKDIPVNWTVGGSLAWNYGKTDDGEYFRHTQPLRGLVSVRWDDTNPKRKAFAEFLVDMTAKYDRIPADRVDTDLAWQANPQDFQGANGLLRSYGGVPGYTIFNLYGGINLCENARLIMALENFTNKKYRRAHSRMDAPGISFTVGLDVVF